MHDTETLDTLHSSRSIDRTISRHTRDVITSAEDFLCWDEQNWHNFSRCRAHISRVSRRPQAPAELLIHEWAKRNFAPIIEFCHTADAFQDIPFSLPYTYQALDMHFPQSKFILTVRSSSEEWYRSICTFHGNLWNNGQVPQINHLKAAKYRYQGYAHEAFKYVYNTPDDDLYNQSMLIQFYERHNAAIIEYFRYRPKDLLILNVSHPTAFHQLCDFLGKPRVDAAFPWENKT